MKNTGTKLFDTAVDKATDVGALMLLKTTTGIGYFMSKRWSKLALSLCFAVSILSFSVFAADAMLAGIENQLTTWIPRLGTLIIVFGGIQLGVAVKDEDSNARARGMQTMIGGAVVAGMGGLISLTGSGS